MAEVYQFPNNPSVDTSVAPSEPTVTRQKWSESVQGVLDGIAKHPEVWPHISSDASLPIDKWSVEWLLKNEDNHFMLVEMDGKAVGFFMVLARTPDVLECHVAMLPEGRGAVATAAFPKLLKYLFCRTGALTLIGQCSSANAAMRKFAHWGGFRTIHVARGEWVKDGVAHDLETMTLTLDRWLVAMAGDMYSKVRTVVQLLAAAGQFAKAEYIYRHYSTLLGDIPTGG